MKRLFRDDDRELFSEVHIIYNAKDIKDINKMLEKEGLEIEFDSRTLGGSDVQEYSIYYNGTEVAKVSRSDDWALFGTDVYKTRWETEIYDDDGFYEDGGWREKIKLVYDKIAEEDDSLFKSLARDL